MEKYYISPRQLLEDSFALAWQVFESGYRPDYVIGIWRGGTPVAIAVHELLEVLGIRADHMAIRTRSYSGIAKRGERVQVDGLEYLAGRVSAGDKLLLVDDVHDTGLSLLQVMEDLQRECGADTPDIRIAVPWFKPGSNRIGRAPDYFVHQTEAWLVFPHELVGLSMAELRRYKPELGALLEGLEDHFD